MTKLIFLTSFFVLAIAVSGFSQANAPNKPIKGKGSTLRVTSDEVYRNDSVGFSMKLPKNWLRESREESLKLVEKAKETDKKLTDTGKKQLDISTPKTAFLFNLRTEPLGTSGNASFISVVEDIQSLASVKTRQIVLSSQQNLARNFGYEVVSPIKRVVLGGRSFYLTSLRKKNIDSGFWQKIYFLKLDNSRVLQFGLTYVYEEDLVTMEKALNTLRFSK